MDANGFVDPTKQTNRVILWLNIAFAIAIAGALSWLFDSIILLYLKNNASMTTDGREFIAALIGIKAGVLLLFDIGVFIVTTVLVLMWVYQLKTNTHHLGVSIWNMKFTPGWSVGWFLIPFANLVQVPKVMNELWKISKDPHNWQSEADEPLVMRWWGLWVAGGMLANLSNRFYKEDAKLEENLLPTLMNLGAEVVSIFAALAMISLVKKIYDMQMAHRQINQPIITS